MDKFKDIDVIAFDADDTLWDNEPFFRRAESEALALLSRYMPEKEAAEKLYRREMANMEDYGYGAMAFTMSLVENAIDISDGKVTAGEIKRIIDLGRELLHVSAAPLEGVESTLRRLRESGRYRMILLTKGELLTQMHKLERSGLAGYFHRAVVLCDKKEKDYLNLCREEGIPPQRLLMVGNSLKSDMLPALNVGACGIFVPYEIMWNFEVIDKFTHDNMITVEKFSEIVNYLL